MTRQLTHEQKRNRTSSDNCVPLICTFFLQKISYSHVITASYLSWRVRMNCPVIAVLHSPEWSLLSSSQEQVFICMRKRQIENRNDLGCFNPLKVTAMIPQACWTPARENDTNAARRWRHASGGGAWKKDFGDSRSQRRCWSSPVESPNRGWHRISVQGWAVVTSFSVDAFVSASLMIGGSESHSGTVILTPLIVGSPSHQTPIKAMKMI